MHPTITRYLCRPKHPQEFGFPRSGESNAGNTGTKPPGRGADRAKPPTFELVHLQLCTIHVCSSERSQSCYAGQIDAADFVQRFGPDSPEPPRSPGQEPRQLGFPGSRDSGRLGDITARTCGPSVPCVESRRAYFQIRFLQAEEA